MNFSKNYRKWKRSAALAALLVCGAAAAPSALNAQVSFTSAQSSLPSVNLSLSQGNPSSQTADPAGDLYVVTSDNQITRIDVNGSQSTFTFSSLVYIYELSSDNAGNIYVLGSDSNYMQSLVILSASGTQTIQPLPAAVIEYFFAGADGAGNLYFYNLPTVRAIYKYSTSGTLIATINRPSGVGGDVYDVSVDRAGNLYMTNAPQIYVALANSNYAVQAAELLDNSISPSEGEINFAVEDAQGMVYFPNGNTLYAINPNGTSLGGSPIAEGSSTWLQVTEDAKGDLFLVGTDGSVTKVQTGAVNLGSANVCSNGQSTPAPCSQTMTLNFAVSQSTMLGTPKVLTLGAPNLDFTLAPGSTCSGTVSGSCSVNVVFAPTTAGMRNGAVQIVDNSGNILASTYVHGTGVASQIAYAATAPVTLADGFGLVSGMAVDASGNVFLADPNNNRAVKIAPGGAQATVGTGLTTPAGVAVDGAGNVYIGDFIDNKCYVVKVTPAGVQTTVASNLTFPDALAVDGAGNLYIGQNAAISGGFTNGVVEVTSAGVVKNVGSDSGNVTSIAVDAAGDVFYGDNMNHAIFEVTPDGVQSTVTTNIINPSSMTVDAAGNLIVIDQGNSTVLQITPSGVQTTIATGFTNPASGAMDSAGDLFLADQTGTAVIELQRSQTPSLTFASTSVGAASSDSPQSVQVENIGNASLNLMNVSVAGNFAQIDGSGSPADCSASASLAPDAACNLSLSFTPTAVGAINGSVVLTDNNLNGNPAMQTIQLNGTGTLATQTINFTGLPTTATLGSAGPYTLNATASSGLPVSYSVSGPASINGSKLTITGTGNVIVTASQAGNADYSAATPVSQSIAVSAATQTITFPAIAAPTVGASVNLSASASSSLAVSFASTTPSTCSVSGTTAKMLAAGICTIQASQPGNANYTAAAPVLQNIKVSVATQTITFPAVAAQTVGASVNLSASASSGLAVSFASTAPSVCSVSGTTAKMLAAGTCTIQASQAGNASYAAATPVSENFAVASASGFKLVATPGSETIRRGDLAAFLLEAQSVNGFSGSVKITCSGGPANSVCGSFPQTVKLMPNQLTLALSGILFPKTTAPGTYTLIFTGTSGSTTATTTVQFNVQN